MTRSPLTRPAIERWLVKKYSARYSQQAVRMVVVRVSQPNCSE